MTQGQRFRRVQLLLSQVRWLITLRWFAAGAIALGALADRFVLHWYDLPDWTLMLALLVAGYNAMFRVVVEQTPKGSRYVKALARTQIVLDLACLSVLVTVTRGLDSPLLGLFVLHMVFASLLLSQAAAYAGAALSIVLVAAGLVVVGRVPEGLDALRGAGWVVTLLATVYLANQITRSLRQHHKDLLAQNRRVRALAARLTRQQQQMIQHEKTVALGQMAAGIAHEIANPLASMDSVLQLMQRSDRKLTQENVDLLRQQAQRIRVILQQLTNFAHPTDYTWQTVPLNELVELGLQVVRFDRRFRSVRLRTELTGQACAVRVQAHAVQQVLTNILINAVDALADSPEPMLTVRSLAEGEAGGAAEGDALDECRIEVTDNGPGIGPRDLAQIFEPFFTTKPVGKGTGLGLAISRSLMEKLGGRIEVRTELGKGTTFAVVIPLRPLPMTASPTAATTPATTAT